MEIASIFKKIFSLPGQLLIAIIAALLFTPFLSEGIVRSFYTFSVIFKELLGVLLLFMLFSFVISSILYFKKKAFFVLIVLVSLAFISNIVTSTISLFTGYSLLSFLVSDMDILSLIPDKLLIPYFGIYIPQLVNPGIILLSAIILGIVFSFIKVPIFDRAMIKLKNFIQKLLLKYFIPLLPLYVFGFLLKMSYEKTLLMLFGSIGKAFILVLLLQALFLLLLYFIAAKFNYKYMLELMKNTLPSYLTAFVTMSSAAAVPVTIESSTKNTGDRRLSEMAAPILANIHLIGDAITIPIFALVIVPLFHGVTLTISSWVTFIFYFCLAMFAAAGIPGGGILIMIPILKSTLSMSPSMISIMTALYLLQDNFGSACNTFGDGALIVLAHKILKIKNDSSGRQV